MSVNLSALSEASSAANGLSGLILVKPQPIGIKPQSSKSKPYQVVNPDGTVSADQETPSFFFDYFGEESLDLQSDITDHYVEDNTAIADQIALRPERYRAAGFIGELNDVIPQEAGFLKILQEKLTVLSAYTPELSITALRVYNEAFRAYQAAINLADNAISSWDTLRGNASVNVITGSESEEEVAALQNKTRNQNKQQIAFQQFYGYWRSRRLFTIQTPWAIFQNMAIENLKAVQDAETEEYSSFEISFKIIRFASTQTLAGLNNENMQSRANVQGAPLVDNGASVPPSDISFTSAIGDIGVS